MSECIRCNINPKEYRSYCKECFKLYKREHYLKNKNNKKLYGYNSEYQKQYRENNKAKAKEYDKVYKKNRYREDILFKLNNNIRKLILYSLKNKSFIKSKRTEDIIGCSFEELKQHLESQFEPWMNWENKGGIPKERNTNWDIDHIIPISSAQSEEEIIKLNHYTNLRPLCSYYNRWIKRDKLAEY